MIRLDSRKMFSKVLVQLPSALSYHELCVKNVKLLQKKVIFYSSVAIRRFSIFLKNNGPLRDKGITELFHSLPTFTLIIFLSLSENFYQK